MKEVMIEAVGILDEGYMTERGIPHSEVDQEAKITQEGHTEEKTTIDRGIK